MAYESARASLPPASDVALAETDSAGASDRSISPA